MRLFSAVAVISLVTADGATLAAQQPAPAYVRVDSGWIGLFGRDSAYARYQVIGPNVQLQDAGRILLKPGLGLMVTFADRREFPGPDLLVAHAKWETDYWRGRATRVDTATRTDLAAGRNDVRVTELTLYNAAGAKLGIDLVGLRAPSGVFAFAFSPAGPAADSAVTRFLSTLSLVARPLGPQELARLSDSLKSRRPPGDR